MTRFVQMHCLTFYPPSNANRDDTGRPKTCIIGGTERLRLSSQAIKRAIRTGTAFTEAFAGTLGERTKELGPLLATAMKEAGVAPEKAIEKAKPLAAMFGKLKAGKGENPLHAETLAFVDPEERAALLDLATRIGVGEEVDDDALKALKKTILKPTVSAVDIALFGRMLAADPAYNVDAAVQVGHAFTVDAVTVEDDYFTAVDDLNTGQEDKGAAHIGATGFGSGVFYLYSCIDRMLLTRNLGGDADLAAKAIKTYARALADASPSGKRAGFAHNPEAEVMLVETGDDQPRTLAGAFQKAIRADDVTDAAARAMMDRKRRMDEGYGRVMEARLFDPLGRTEGNAPEGVATLDAIADFAGRG